MYSIHPTPLRAMALVLSIPSIAFSAPTYGANLGPTISTAQVQQSPDETGIAESAPADAPAKASRIVDEVIFGVLSHDASPVESNRPESGVDLNGEVRFVSPRVLRYILAPRPHLGLTVNTNGQTSQLYAGVTWTLNAWRRRLFFDIGLGFSVHDGRLNDPSGQRLSLGSRVLFRAAGDLGFRFGKVQQYSLSAFWDHASNADLLGHPNQGLDTIGARFGYRIP